METGDDIIVAKQIVFRELKIVDVAAQIGLAVENGRRGRDGGAIDLPPQRPVNQSAPSEPTVMPYGLAAGETGYSMMAPAVVIRPIVPGLGCVNQSAPSGPTVMPPVVEPYASS